MEIKSAKRVLTIAFAVFSVSLMVGCSGLAPRHPSRTGFWYYHTPLVEADRALDEARATGKDRECPAEFNALKDRVDKAYAVYAACHTQEAIGLAQAATVEIRALCPPKARVEMKPAAKPEPMPGPRVAQTVILLEDVHFDLDKSSLTPEAQMILKRNIQVLKENPDMKIVIQGHTSAIATEEYNQKLSERRVASVNEFLQQQGGIGPSRLSTIGYGETRLEKPEPNPEIVESPAAKVNRRVIFKVIVK